MSASFPLCRGFLAALGIAFATSAFAEVSLPAPADESYGKAPGSMKVCINERVIFRPKLAGSLKAAAAGQRIELVRERVCGAPPRSISDQRLLPEP